MPDIEKVGSKDENSCSKRTTYNGRKLCIIFQTDKDKVNTLVCCYQNNTYLKVTEMDSKLTENKKLLFKRVYFLSYLDIFYKLCIVLRETTVDNCFKVFREWTFSFS